MPERRPAAPVFREFPILGPESTLAVCAAPASRAQGHYEAIHGELLGVTPTNDDVDEGDEALTVDGSVTGLAVTSAALTIEDDDERGVTVTPTTLTVPEAGSATYTVVLTSQPTGTVTVTPSVGGNSEVTVSGALTFTTGISSSRSDCPCRERVRRAQAAPCRRGTR